MKRRNRSWYRILLLFGIFFFSVSLNAAQAAQPRAAKPGGSQVPRDTDSELIQSVSLERAHLKRLQRNLLLEQNRLQQTRKEVEARILVLQKLQEDLKTRIVEWNKRLQTKQDQETRHLVKVYEAMSPEEAGPLVSALDQRIAVKLLSRMKDKKAGKILEAMEKKKAVRLTEILASMKKMKKKKSR